MCLGLHMLAQHEEKKLYCGLHVLSAEVRGSHIAQEYAEMIDAKNVVPLHSTLCIKEKLMWGILNFIESGFCNSLRGHVPCFLF